MKCDVDVVGIIWGVNNVGSGDGIIGVGCCDIVEIAGDDRNDVGDVANVIGVNDVDGVDDTFPRVISFSRVLRYSSQGANIGTFIFN